MTSPLPPASSPSVPPPPGYSRDCSRIWGRATFMRGSPLWDARLCTPALPGGLSFRQEGEVAFIFISLCSVWPLLKGEPQPQLRRLDTLCSPRASSSCSSPLSRRWTRAAVEAFEARPQQREQLLWRLFECAAASPSLPPLGSDWAAWGHTARLQLPGPPAMPPQMWQMPPTPTSSLTHICLGFGISVTPPLFSPADHNQTPPLLVCRLGLPPLSSQPLLTEVVTFPEFACRSEVKHFKASYRGNLVYAECLGAGKSADNTGQFVWNVGFSSRCFTALTV